MSLAAHSKFSPVLHLGQGLSWPARIAALVILGYLVVALTAPLWIPYDPFRIMIGPRLAPPSLQHLLGTDQVGRDVFSRVVWGSRPVLVLALVTTTLAVGIGTFIGILAAYWQGVFDLLVMRLTDVFVAIPPLIIALLVISALGNAPVVMISIVAFIYLIRTARILRAATLAIVTEDYVTAAVLRGDSTLSLIGVELLPNVLGTAMVEFAVRAGFVIVFIGALGFLGFGAAPPSPEWGVMINEGRGVILQSIWPVFGPAMAMAILVVALNVLTDGIARRLETGHQGETA
ncbi:MAG: ABC transporter permease [Rhodobacteraceae bacterium]|nr:ABC transporter permease [Paracoccaceae bacterium]